MKKNGMIQMNATECKKKDDFQGVSTQVCGELEIKIHYFWPAILNTQKVFPFFIEIKLIFFLIQNFPTISRSHHFEVESIKFQPHVHLFYFCTT
jgi:hypothetical protein